LQILSIVQLKLVREQLPGICRNNMLFVETSAKTAANTSELFEVVARQIAKANTSVASQQQAATATSSELPTSQATA